MCKVLAGNEGGTAGLLPRPSKDEVFYLSSPDRGLPIMQPRPVGRGFFVAVGTEVPVTAK